MISVFGSQVSPRLMSSLRVGMPVAGCQVGVARISGQMASPVTDSLYLSTMLPSDFSIVFQPPMVVGQRPRATSPLPTRACRRPSSLWTVAFKLPGVGIR
jgi:hypothetical protein